MRKNGIGTDGAPTGVRLDNLTKRHSRSLPPAVDGVSLDIWAGEFLTLLGPSGSGKSTILSMLAGFSKPTSGAVFLGEQNVTDIPPHKRNVGMVFQNYALFPHLTISENVAFPLRRRGLSRVDAQEKARAALDMVHLAHIAHRKPAELSGGQQQRVAVARAIVYRPRLILMDEPFGALDKNLRIELQLEMLKLHQELGVAFVFVTHDQEEALSMSDRIAVLEDGRLRQVGTPDELYERPRSRFVAEFLGESNLFVGEGKGGAVAATTGPIAINSTVTAPELTVVVRPERVRLAEESAVLGAGWNAIPCTIEEVIYLGWTRRIVVRFPDGSRGIARESSSEAVRFAPGDRAIFSWAVEDGTVLPEASAGAAVMETAS